MTPKLATSRQHIILENIITRLFFIYKEHNVETFLIIKKRIPQSNVNDKEEHGRQNCCRTDMLKSWIEEEKNVSKENGRHERVEKTCVVLPKEKHVAIKDVEINNTTEWLPEIPFENVSINQNLNLYKSIYILIKINCDSIII